MHTCIPCTTIHSYIFLYTLAYTTYTTYLPACLLNSLRSHTPIYIYIPLPPRHNTATMLDILSIYLFTYPTDYTLLPIRSDPIRSIYSLMSFYISFFLSLSLSLSLPSLSQGEEKKEKESEWMNE
ncbi:hypothetical protein F4775DRAFT_43764 [Biscogniauxia sp. FL1348]|nr:hypothetical protein F4775DRAFT_43764 [Biscogniauxia sp. FL1348]